jgi:hypothetical protein
VQLFLTMRPFNARFVFHLDNTVAAATMNLMVVADP